MADITAVPNRYIAKAQYLIDNYYPVPTSDVTELALFLFEKDKLINRSVDRDAPTSTDSRNCNGDFQL